MNNKKEFSIQRIPNLIRLISRLNQLSEEVTPQIIQGFESQDVQQEFLKAFHHNPTVGLQSSVDSLLNTCEQKIRIR